MKVQKYLELVADIVASDLPGDDGKIYVSKFDGSYITRVGMEDDIKFLADREITEELTHGVGFSPKDGKWYGWSHRAIYGFQVGSTCKKGDCHYRPENIEDELEDCVRFWSDDDNRNVKAEVINPGLIHVSWEYKDTVPNKTLHNTIGGVNHYYDPDNFGRGEWVAKTIEDAKQMAIDFNKGVS